VCENRLNINVAWSGAAFAQQGCLSENGKPLSGKYGLPHSNILLAGGPAVMTKKQRLIAGGVRLNLY
jgi:hypothetical protein